MAKEFLNRIFFFRLQSATSGYSRGPWHMQLHLNTRVPTAEPLRFSGVSSPDSHLEVFTGCAPRLEEDSGGNFAVPIKVVLFQTHACVCMCVVPNRPRRPLSALHPTPYAPYPMSYVRCMPYTLHSNAMCPIFYAPEP